MIPSILECPKCWARACDDCLTQFGGMQRNVTENDKASKNLPCSQCHEKVQMKQSNRIMTYLLKNVFRINCDECKRHWLYDDYLSHKTRGMCRFDRNADNNMDALAAIDRRPTLAGASMSGTSTDQSAAMQASLRQATAQAAVVSNGSHLTSIYILERDSKYIYEYSLAKKQVFRRSVNMQMSFQHNFAYI
jgi:hypothetical protein